MGCILNKFFVTLFVFLFINNKIIYMQQQSKNNNKYKNMQKQQANKQISNKLKEVD